MARNHIITADELEHLTAFAETGDTEALDTDAAQRLFNLAALVGRRLAEAGTAAAKRNLMLECKLEKYRKRDREAADGNGFTDTMLDSADVALALLYCLQERHPWRLTKSKVMLILYEMYASWLVSKKQRLFIEHPVAAEWGPQMWRAYKHIDVAADVPHECFRRLAEQSSAVAQFCRNAATKYYDCSEDDLRKIFTDSEPYRNALPERNGGKWGRPFSDTEIYAWRLSKAGGLKPSDDQSKQS